MDSYVFHVDEWGEEVGKGATSPRYCTLDGVVKVNNDRWPNVVFNEFICGRLGLVIGLPVPPGAVVQTADGGFGYVALRFGKKGEKPPPTLVEHLVEDHPKIVSGVITFDCWIQNSDRHTENIAYSRDLGLTPVVFDHSHALLGPTQITAEKLLEAIDEPCVENVLPKAITNADSFPEWCDRIAIVPNEQIHSLCDDATRIGIVGREISKAVANFLIYRKNKLRAFLVKSENKFPRIEQWSLL